MLFDRDKKQRILLIEDDLSLQAIFDSLIHDIDSRIEIDWVTSAETACEMLEEASLIFGKSPYDLMIADIFLEGKITGADLWTLCQNVYPKMPALVMSGLPMHKLFDFIGEGGICPPFLQKPLNVSDCQQMIQGILENED